MKVLQILEGEPNVDKVLQKTGGEQLYSTLSQNIHRYQQKQKDAYTIKETQWDTIVFEILSALRPRLRDGGHVDWKAERERFGDS